MDEYIKREDALDAVLFALVGTGHQSRAIEAIRDVSTADVVPKSEVEKIFEKLKARERSNSVCAWCVHATDYGRRNEECDKPYIDKNGKDQKACYVYAKFESLIDNELAELKKKYTEENK